MRCFPMFHDYSDWSEPIQVIGQDKHQYRKCWKCNKVQARTVSIWIGYKSDIRDVVRVLGYDKK